MGKRALAVIFAMALIGVASSARAEECRLVVLASFDIGESDAVVIPVGINGTEAHFLIDTGGFMSTISPGVIDALHLTPRRIENGTEIYMADGTQLDKMVTVSELHIGVGTAKHVPLIVQP